MKYKIDLLATPEDIMRQVGDMWGEVFVKVKFISEDKQKIEGHLLGVYLVYWATVPLVVGEIRLNRFRDFTQDYTRVEIFDIRIDKSKLATLIDPSLPDPERKRNVRRLELHVAINKPFKEEICLLYSHLEEVIAHRPTPAPLPTQPTEAEQPPASEVKQPPVSEAEQPPASEVEQPPVSEVEQPSASEVEQPQPTPPSTEAKQPELPAWEQIPDHRWDRQVLKLWWEGLTCGEISNRTYVAGEGRIRNRLTELRIFHGESIVPTDVMRQKMKL